MASIGGTITHSPNTSGSDICWVLFHSSDINPIHQLFCQLPLSGLRGDCSFEGSEYCFILAPHLLLTKFDWIFFFIFAVLILPGSLSCILSRIFSPCLMPPPPRAFASCKHGTQTKYFTVQRLVRHNDCSALTLILFQPVHFSHSVSDESLCKETHHLTAFLWD